MLFLSVARGVEGEGVEGEGAASRVTFSRIYIGSQVGVALNQDFIRIKLKFLVSALPRLRMRGAGVGSTRYEALRRGQAAACGVGH